MNNNDYLNQIKAFAESKVDKDWIHTHWLSKDLTVTSKGKVGRFLWGLASKFPWIQEKYFSHVDLKESRKAIIAHIDSGQLDQSTIQKVIKNFNEIVKNLKINRDRSIDDYAFQKLLSIQEYSGEEDIKRELDSLQANIIKSLLPFYSTEKVNAFAALFIQQSTAHSFEDLKKPYYSHLNDSTLKQKRLELIKPEIEKLEGEWKNIEAQLIELDKQKQAAMQLRSEKLIPKGEFYWQEQKQLASYPFPQLPKSLDEIEEFPEKIKESSLFFDKECKEILPAYSTMNNKVISSTYSRRFSPYAKPKPLEKALSYVEQDVVDFFWKYLEGHYSQAIQGTTEEIQGILNKLERYKKLVDSIDFSCLAALPKDLNIYSKPELQSQDLAKLSRELDEQMQKAEKLQKQSKANALSISNIKESFNVKKEDLLEQLAKAIHVSLNSNKEAIQDLAKTIIEYQSDKVCNQCIIMIKKGFSFDEVEQKLHELIEKIDIETIISDCINFHEAALRKVQELEAQLAQKKADFEQGKIDGDDFGPDFDPKQIDFPLTNQISAFFQQEEQAIRELTDFRKLDQYQQSMQSMQSLIQLMEWRADVLQQNINNSHQNLLQLILNLANAQKLKSNLYNY